MVEHRTRGGRRPLVAAASFVAAAMLLGLAMQSAAQADVSGVTASAYGYRANVSLLGGPFTVRGFGQTIPPGTPESASPSVSCPSEGTALPVTATDPDGALAFYGPAPFFSGQWPAGATSPPPSGPLTVSCHGTLGPAGSASSSADVINVGPGPFVADEVHSTCTATESSLVGTTTIVDGTLQTSTDPTTGEPTSTAVVPSSPAPNLTITGTLNHVGDTFRAVFNEQIVSGGVLTVNAVHLYLLGPNARGDVIIGSSTCGVTVTGSTSTTSTTGGGPPPAPTDPAQCKDGGYAAFGFSNQGRCVAAVVSNRGGA